MIDPQIQGTAIILTDGALKDGPAKTAHGLIRGTDRFTILGVIDPVWAGHDAGEVLDGKKRNIPVYATVQEAIRSAPQPIQYALVGIAPKGGKLPPEMIRLLLECIRHGLHIVSGLHQYLNDIPELVQEASQKGVQLIDIRKPKPKDQLHFWSGKIFEVTCPIVAVLGMDTKIGKRTTTRLFTEACRRHGLRAEMISTGQTGWMQGANYGFVLDTMYNDFVSGELEYAIHSCFTEQHPDVIFLEGQSGLRNPSGPCGAEFLLSGGARYVILQYAPKRIYFDDNPAWGPIPELTDEIALIRMYGSEVIAVTLNTEKCSLEEALQYQQTYRSKTGLPVFLPLEQGFDEGIGLIRQLITSHKSLSA
ncbi:putative NAD-dependent epimerase/dehydratase family protein [Thermoflavifilum aggregans]|uniref:Putative NAD-dependent epimerase/dehydratase family protein n=1 Tax=Thermoflavifilum aggregans TaxID=454188 RepID=A0A2M9CW22_9BACT|nr:DUF1611 domain-containing protein [Thermoflavifilum aggregans]PJJ76111.1 putative NAD-dependent epimerase/dehydratase family protein [Thermoflavifilum aggregans]